MELFCLGQWVWNCLMKLEVFRQGQMVPPSEGENPLFRVVRHFLKVEVVGSHHVRGSENHIYLYLPGCTQHVFSGIK